MTAVEEKLIFGLGNIYRKLTGRLSTSRRTQEVKIQFVFEGQKF